MTTIIKYTVNLLLLLIILVLSVSCHVQGGELQEYIVEKGQQPQFTSLTVPTSLLGDELKAGLSKEELEIYNSIKKLNILMLPNSADNYENEKETLKTLLKNNEDFEELMSLNDKRIKGKLYYIGDDDSIDEVIVFASNKDNGFLLLRILGDEMKVENLGKLVDILQKTGTSGDSVPVLRDFFSTHEGIAIPAEEEEAVEN